jgi:transposase
MTSKGPGKDGRHHSATGRRGHPQRHARGSLHPAGRVRRFANSAKGCGDLIAWLGGCAIARVAFEPSGGYHRACERCRAAAGLPLVKVNPRHARRFAEAIGRHAKLVLGPANGRTRETDAIDAAMLARFAALLEPPCGLSSARPSMP